MKICRKNVSFITSIKKVSLVLLFSLLIIPTFNSVFAVDLKYMADVADGASSATIRVFSQPHDNSKEYGWTPDNGNYTGGNETLATYGIGFQGLRNFTQYSDSGSSKIYYDAYNDFISRDDISRDKLDYFSGRQVQVVGASITGNEGYDIYYPGSSSSTSFRRTQARNIKNKNGTMVKEVEFFIGKSILDEIVNKYLDKPEHRDGDNLKVKFSLPVSTTRTDKGEWYVLTQLPTGYKAINWITPKAAGWRSYNWGNVGRKIFSWWFSFKLL